LIKNKSWEVAKSRAGKISAMVNTATRNTNGRMEKGILPLINDMEASLIFYKYAGDNQFIPSRVLNKYFSGADSLLTMN
jgi:hypothetical protein